MGRGMRGSVTADWTESFSGDGEEDDESVEVRVWSVLREREWVKRAEVKKRKKEFSTQKKKKKARNNILMRGRNKKLFFEFSFDLQYTNKIFTYTITITITNTDITPVLKIGI